ncbi:CvfD/Ygs/GSP13 family RNA-binding post-transcriptional regulator [Ligilactobacillus cholophilus]|uniref:CvfD/Ygs/GSP13 family RNA-binding post-transcriptional regulator n=1 Tax=Ligilactobacillus cholophilus TaxID=3050131 RepID=UPI0025AF6DFB|nr:CvfD/Ygs/GSP13 family RNA-binding post-transcriptional regulator [Ligilactobacillus cholophilus]
MDYRIGMILSGKITGIQPYGAFVMLDDKTQGLIHISELKHGYISDIENCLKIGQSVKVMIIDIDEYTKKISLSLRCMEKPFNFKYNRDEIAHQYKKYWSNKHLNIGFEPIKNHLDFWINEALNDIEKKDKKNLDLN